MAGRILGYRRKQGSNKQQSVAQANWQVAAEIISFLAPNPRCQTSSSDQNGAWQP